MNNVEQGVASVGRKGHHHVHIAVFGIEVIAQHRAEKLERPDVPLVAEIVDLILWNWNARRDLSDHGQNHITASRQDRPNFGLAFQSATGSRKRAWQRVWNPPSLASSRKAKCAPTKDMSGQSLPAVAGGDTDS